MSRKYATLGGRHRRIDAPDKVTGRAVYADDLTRPDMLHGALLQSPWAHARIVSIDDSEALTIDGVVGVFTASDLGLDRPTPVAHPHPLLTEARTAEALATDEVCHAGQAVVVVVATDRYAAADGADAEPQTPQ